MEKHICACEERQKNTHAWQRSGARSIVWCRVKKSLLKKVHGFFFLLQTVIFIRRHAFHPIHFLSSLVHAVALALFPQSSSLFYYPIALSYVGFVLALTRAGSFLFSLLVVVIENVCSIVNFMTFEMPPTIIDSVFVSGAHEYMHV